MLAALTVSAAVWSYELWSQSETSHLPSLSELRFWSDGVGYLSPVGSPCLHVLRPLSRAFAGLSDPLALAAQITALFEWACLFRICPTLTSYLLPGAVSVFLCCLHWHQCCSLCGCVGVCMMLKFSCKCHRYLNSCCLKLFTPQISDCFVVLCTVYSSDVEVQQVK